MFNASVTLYLASLSSFFFSFSLVMSSTRNEQTPKQTNLVRELRAMRGRGEIKKETEENEHLREKEIREK